MMTTPKALFRRAASPVAAAGLAASAADTVVVPSQFEVWSVKVRKVVEEPRVCSRSTRSSEFFQGR